MNCKKARELMVLDLYSEAGSPEKARLDEHVRGCASCAAEKAEMSRLFTLLNEHKPEEGPAADWEKAWMAIQAGIGEKSRAPRLSPRLSPASSSRPFFVPRWRRAFAGTALVVVLAAGIVIGRFGFGPAAKPGASGAPAAVSAGSQAAIEAAASSSSTTVPAPNGIRPAFASHLEDLKPILLDYAHYVPGEKTEGRVVVDEAALRTLMLQNVLLKRKLAEKDPAAADLLEDLDLILKEIVNRGSQDTKSPAVIRDLIEKRDVLFKMEILKKT